MSTHPVSHFFLYMYINLFWIQAIPSKLNLPWISEFVLFEVLLTNIYPSNRSSNCYVPAVGKEAVKRCHWPSVRPSDFRFSTFNSRLPHPNFINSYTMIRTETSRQSSNLSSEKLTVLELYSLVTRRTVSNNCNCILSYVFLIQILWNSFTKLRITTQRQCWNFGC